VSPDGPEHFDVYAKTMTMIDSEPEIDLAKLAAVFAPALVLQGTGMRSRSSMGPRVPRLWEMAGLRCFRARTACRSNCPKSIRCSSRSLRGALCCLTEDFLRQGPGEEHLRHSGACQRI
jgi:hypothetical protein